MNNQAGRPYLGIVRLFIWYWSDAHGKRLVFPRKRVVLALSGVHGAG